MAAQRKLNKKYRPTERTGYWRCKVCQCTDRHACEGGCSWVSERLCSSCQCSAIQLLALMALGCSGADFVPTLDDLAKWTPIELGQAGSWAKANLYWIERGRVPHPGPVLAAPAQPAWIKKRLLSLEKKARPYLFR